MTTRQSSILATLGPSAIVILSLIAGAMPLALSAELGGAPHRGSSVSNSVASAPTRQESHTFDSLPSSSTLNAGQEYPATTTTVHVGHNPDSATYDSSNGYVYVSNTGSGNVSVIHGGRLIASISVGGQPGIATYDSENGCVYVTNRGSTNVSVINGTQLVRSLNVGNSTDFALYDARNGFVYVSSTNSGYPSNVTVISGTSIVGRVPVGSDPGPAAYATYIGYVYVPNFGSSTVTVINGTTVVRTLAVGGSPSYATYDGGNGEVYVSNPSMTYPPYVTIINVKTVVGTVKVGSFVSGPSSEVYDGVDGNVYVTLPTSNSVVAINGTRLVGQVPVGTEPLGVAFDQANGEVFVANEGSNNVSVVKDATLLGAVAVGSKPSSVTYDRGNGNLYVTDSGSDNVTVITPYAGALRLTVTVDPIVTDLGKPVNFTATASGGVPPYTFAWNYWVGHSCGLITYGTPWTPWTCPNEESTSFFASSILRTMDDNGSQNVTVGVTDAAGSSAISSQGFFLNPPLRISATDEKPALLLVGESALFSGSILGGTPPYNVSWTFGDGAGADSLAALHSYARPGPFNVQLRVSDAVGAAVNASLNISVGSAAAASPSNFLGIPAAELYAVVGGIIAGVAVGFLAGVVWMQKRTSPPVRREST